MLINNSEGVLIKLQKLLKQYMKDNSLFRLKNMLNDNVVIYDYDTKRKILRQENFYKRAKSIISMVMKRRRTISKLELDEDFLEMVKKIVENYKEEENKTKSKNENSSKFLKATNEMISGFVKDDFATLKGMEDFKIKEKPMNKNFVQSNSHLAFLKKIEEINTQSKSLEIGLATCRGRGLK